MRIRRFNESKEGMLNIERAWIELIEDAEATGEFTVSRKVVMGGGHRYVINGEYKHTPIEPESVVYTITIKSNTIKNPESFKIHNETKQKIYEDVYVACARTEDEFSKIEIKIREEILGDKSVLTVKINNIDEYNTHKI